MPSIQEPVERPCVILPQGKIRGILQRDTFPQAVECFLGFPYAQAPVGELRFRPPAKLAPSSDTFDASAYGPAAPGKPLIPPRIPLSYSEDCLTVNVFRPSGKGAKVTLLPVAVYVHGGAFNRGHSSMQNTASMVAWSEDPFVAVSFNYRVGALGFLPSTKSAEEGILNLGMQDQRFLLEWVQDNIHFFGGDKSNITLIGLSAGAITIGHFLFYYSNKPDRPFHRAIIQSGSSTSRDCRPYNAAVIEGYFKEFLSQVGCPLDLSAANTFAFLRKLPLSTITEGQSAVFNKYKPTMQWAFRPVIDRTLIPRPPMESWRMGLYCKIPIMTGFCTNEGSLFMDLKISGSQQFTNFMRTLLSSLPDKDVDRLNELYPDPLLGDTTYKDERVGKDIGEQYMRTEAAYGQYSLIAPIRQTAHLASSKQDGGPVYLYHWDVFTTLFHGAAHGDNLRYETFEQATTSLSTAQEEVAGFLHAYITSFICHNGDPNRIAGRWKHRPVWHPYTHDQPLTMILGKGNRELIGGPVGVPAELARETWAMEQCRFWWERTERTQQ